MSNTVSVIGAGPAGMFAAYVASSEGKEVTVFEKNPYPGKKLLITGKGRCNVTNSAPIEEFIKNTAVNPYFLYSAFYTFTNDDLIALIENEGVKLKTERGGRVFPVSDKASDIRDVFKSIALKSGVKFIYDEVVETGRCETGFFIKTKNGLNMESDSLIIATGGVSYPGTGSTGDGYRFAKKFGHSIVTAKASLVPLCTEEEYVRDIMGLSLRNVAVKLFRNGKEIYSDFGEMLFTHFGVSGPVILSASSHIRDEEKYKITIDLKPALDFKTLDKRILRDFEDEKNKDFINALDSLLPKKLIPVIVKLSGIDERRKVNSVTREERHNLVRLLKELTFNITSKRPVSEAIITSGGVDVKEIDPGTMQSKITEGLFFAGEVIDVDAYTGGYNLQIAFSTAYLAGKNA